MPDRSQLVGCSVEWMRQPDKQNRLLEWLENHPRDRKCLFHEQGYRDFNKIECAIRAAQAIFANDENPYNSHGVRLDPRPFAQSIRNHIRLVCVSRLYFLDVSSSTVEADGPQSTERSITSSEGVRPGAHTAASNLVY